MPNRLMVTLEAQLGPDPLNPCADLAGISSAVLERIITLRAELRQLEQMHDNILDGIDRFCRKS